MRTIHIVSHTHWDREWYLTFQQFRLKLVHLVDGLLELLERDPQYSYFMLDGQAIILEDYTQLRPEREAELRKHIQEGRILVGPWYILPDEFLVSPEATIRNMLQGERTLQRFGPKMKVGYLPDTFGHIGQMPQILRGFGIETASLMRGLADEPCELSWQSPDGSQVLLAYLRDSYGNAAGLPVHSSEQFYEEIERLVDDLSPFAATENILLMLGTDHMEPPPEISRLIAFAREKGEGKYLLFHSTLPAYLGSVRSSLGEKQLPVVTGELRNCKRHPLLPNVLSSRMWIKQRNHLSETLLEKWCEPFSTWAEQVTRGEINHGNPVPQVNLSHPSRIIRQAWRLLMENHPHDSICGCSIDQVHAEMRSRFDQVEQIGEEITRQSLQALAEAIDTNPIKGSEAPTDLVPIVVFNPSSQPRTDWVECTFELPQGTNDFDLVDDTDTVLPSQTVGLGGRDLIHMTMDRKDFRNSIGMISEGRIAGMALQALQLRREADQCFIEVVMSETGEPDMLAWQQGIETITHLLEDASVTTYHVHARSAAATRLLFCASSVPGLGYRTFRVRSKAGYEAKPQHLNPLAGALLPFASRLLKNPQVQRLVNRLAPDPTRKPPYRIENEFFNVEADQDGTLILHDKRSGLVFRGLNRFVDTGDCGDEYNYSPLEQDTSPATLRKFVRVMRGAARQTLELHLEMHVPSRLAPDRKSRSQETVTIPIISRVSLAQGVPRLDVQTEIDNRACDHRLRVHFPASFEADLADHDGHFEVVRRKIGVGEFDASWIEQPRPEVPQRAFTDLADDQHGLLIANRGLPEVEVLKRSDGSAEIALTLLRSVGWLSRDDFTTRKGHAGPALETPEAQMTGKWTFEYAIIPHAGAEVTPVYHQAYAFQSPLRAVSTSFHPGNLPAQAALVAVEPPEFVVSAVKVAEDERGWLVRGYNLSDREITVRLKPWRPFTQVERVNLAEEKSAFLQPTQDGSIQLTARGHEIVTVLFAD